MLYHCEMRGQSGSLAPFEDEGAAAAETALQKEMYST